MPENGYGMAKLCAENMTRSLCHQYGIRHIWPILFSVYGPRDATESMIDTTIRGVLKGDSIKYTKCEQIWNYLYSKDAAKALFLLAINGVDGEAYNVASRTEKRLSDYVNEIYNVIDRNVLPELGALPYPDGKCKYLMADVSKLVDLTGFEEEYNFRKGIEEIIMISREEEL